MNLKSVLLHRITYAECCSVLIFREGKGRRKRGGKRKRNINVWLPLAYPPTGDLACNTGMCPDRESN